MDQERETRQWIEGLLRDYIKNSPQNSLGYDGGEKAWQEPLIGFSGGSDPIYKSFKDHIGEFYFTPEEIFSLTFPEEKASPDELTVISWILPHREAIKRDNRQETLYPSEKWARARSIGDKANTELRKYLISSLASAGHKAVAPDLSPFKRNETSRLYGRATTWSERHAAFASGLGTFGVCDGLITAAGKAVRCGSVVARLVIPSTPRNYENHHAYCLFFQGKKCLKCAERCPVGAISAERGHDKEKCHKFLHHVTADYMKSQFGLDGHACGLCQTGVPCESGIPTGG